MAGKDYEWLEGKGEPTPYEVASILRECMSLDDALDLLRATADEFGGWNDRLNLVGLALLKPDAPRGEERAA